MSPQVPVSFKPLFTRSLSADPERLHFAAHSHHLWPDASFAGQVEAWDDAARLADRKWAKVMGEVWPEAQLYVAREIGTGDPEAILFAPNTHQLVVSLFAAGPAQAPVRVLTSDGEFHSARRQFARWEEAGATIVDRIPVEPFESFPERLVEAAEGGGYDMIFVSQVMFGSGRVFDKVDELAALGRPGGPWVVIDGYHAFMAIEEPFGKAAAQTAFYLGGGYKYAMAGEGCAFMHAPAGFGERPPITGWYAEFEDLDLPPGSIGYAKDARRFLGATFDPSALYRFNAVQRMLQENGITTGRMAGYVAELQSQLCERIGSTPLADAELLNPLDSRPHARFLAFRTPNARGWHEQLMERNCITDVRADVLRIGMAIYHDDEDVDRLVTLLGALS